MFWYAYHREMNISLKTLYIWHCMVEYNTVYLRIILSCFVHCPKFVLCITDPSVSLSFAVCIRTAPREASRLLRLTFLCGTWLASLSPCVRCSLYISLVSRSTRRGPVVRTYLHIDVRIVCQPLTILFLFKRTFLGGSFEFRNFARLFRWEIKIKGSVFAFLLWGVDFKLPTALVLRVEGLLGGLSGDSFTLITSDSEAVSYLVNILDILCPCCCFLTDCASVRIFLT